MRKFAFLTILLALFGLNNYLNAQTVTDIDGNIYNAVTIGTQVWMKENLKATKYRNGDAIPTTTSASIPNDSTSKYQWSISNDSDVATYGRFYTWYAVTDSRNVCPIGWHIPADAEWCTLENFVEINTDTNCDIEGGRGTNIGSNLKEAGTAHWINPNTGANNSSGFNALPGGYRLSDGTSGYRGKYGNWWSATKHNGTNAWGKALHYDDAKSYRYNYSKILGFSVRCLMDSGSTGLNEGINNQFFKLFPNPNYGKFNIIIPKIATGEITMEIYNLLGEKVLHQQISNEIDLSNSPKGIYFVKVYDGPKIYNQKIVVQ